MQKRVGPNARVFAAMCVVACACGSAVAQEESELTAKLRILPGIGPGLRTMKRGADGRYYVLASPAPGLMVFDGAGKQLLSVNEFPASTAGASKSHPPLIAFGEDCDVDAEGKVYWAARGAS